MWNRRHLAPLISQGINSANSLSGTATGEYAIGRPAVGNVIASLGRHPNAEKYRPELDLDAGEREAISLAQEIHADAVLMDDRAGRNAAKRCGLAVVGTVGVLEEAAARGFIKLPEIMERLRNTNVRLDPELVRAALERDKSRSKSSGSDSP